MVLRQSTVLRQSPFPNSFLHGLHSVSWALIFPCYWFLERFLSSFIETSEEKEQRQSQRCSLYPLRVFFCSALFLLLLILSMPIALLGFIIWAPLQVIRRPYCYQHSPSQSVQKEWAAPEKGKAFIFVSANLCLLPDGLARFSNLSHTQRRSALIGQNIVHWVTRQKAPPNPESLKNGILPRDNLHPPVYGAINLNHPGTARQRSGSSVHAGEDAESTKEGKFTGHSKDEGATNSLNCLVIDIDVGDQEPQGRHAAENGGSASSSSAEGSMQNRDLLEDDTGASESLHSSDTDLVTSLADCERNSSMAGGRSTRDGDTDGSFRCEISQLIPAGADFICLQEVFDKRAASRLSTLLSPVYEHILYDVGVYGPLGCSDFKFFNSGLFLASRYPILLAQYRHFPNGSGEDALAAKGLLCVKVLIGSIQGKRIVGYVNCTHLHAPEADGHVRCAQLSTLLSWIGEFQEKNSDASELIAFDVLCGDLNFDNCSTGDHQEQGHEIFSIYEDPCRAGPRKDKEWAIGTLLQQWKLYDDAVNAAQSLQRTLENEESRRKYIAPPINPDGSPDESDTGAPWTGRRIDYILYRGSHESSLQTELEEFTFITHLAGLTDHLAVGLRMFVSGPVQEP